jgi:hypothetical protein
MDPLIDRFEFPMDKNRWDSPLFTVSVKSLDPISEHQAILPLTAPNLAPEDPIATASKKASTAKSSSWKAKPKRTKSTPSKGSGDGNTSPPNESSAAANATTLTSFYISDPPVAAGGAAEDVPPVPLGAGVAVSLATRATALPMSSNSQPTIPVFEHTVESACDAVWCYSQTTTVQAPNSSTVSVPHAAPDLLYAMTQTVNGQSYEISAS